MHIENESLEVTIENVAAAAHEANRRYCIAIGDKSQVSWELSPDWVKESAIAGVKSVLDNLDISPKELHQKWTDHKLADGWVYRELKDGVDKTHPCLVHYDDLPHKQKLKDILFRQTVEFYAPFIQE